MIGYYGISSLVTLFSKKVLEEKLCSDLYSTHLTVKLFCIALGLVEFFGIFMTFCSNGSQKTSKLVNHLRRKQLSGKIATQKKLLHR